MVCFFREKRKALVTGPPFHFLFLMCLIIFTTSTIQIIAIIKSPKADISVPPQISTIGTIIIASKSIMPITNNNVITLSPSFHYRPCRFREKEKNMATSSLSAISRWFPVSWSSKASIRISPFLIIARVFYAKKKSPCHSGGGFSNVIFASYSRPFCRSIYVPIYFGVPSIIPVKGFILSHFGYSFCVFPRQYR